MTSEAHIQYSILAAWGSHPRLRLWRANTGVAQMGERSVRFGVPGQADISGLMLPDGRRLEVECKTAKGRQSEDQKRWERMITAMGGLYVLARSLEDVDRALAALGITR
jgi:hypothetical protein